MIVYWIVVSVDVIISSCSIAALIRFFMCSAKCAVLSKSSNENPIWIQLVGATTQLSASTLSSVLPLWIVTSVVFSTFGDSRFILRPRTTSTLTVHFITASSAFFPLWRKDQYHFSLGWWSCLHVLVHH